MFGNHTELAFPSCRLQRSFASKIFIVLKHNKIEVWASSSSTGRMKVVLIKQQMADGRKFQLLKKWNPQYCGHLSSFHSVFVAWMLWSHNSTICTIVILLKSIFPGLWGKWTRAVFHTFFFYWIIFSSHAVLTDECFQNELQNDYIFTNTHYCSEPAQNQHTNNLKYKQAQTQNKTKGLDGPFGKHSLQLEWEKLHAALTSAQAGGRIYFPLSPERNRERGRRGNGRQQIISILHWQTKWQWKRPLSSGDRRKPVTGCAPSNSVG